MVMRFGSSGILVLFATVAAGCASAGGGSGGELGSRNFTQDVGKATPRDVEQRTPLILQRYHYVVVRTEASELRMYFETDWRARAPFEDEAALGISSARTRIIIRARQRGGAIGGSNLMNVDFIMENLALDERSGEWRQGVVTDMFRAYAKEIADRLEDEYIRGIRVF